MYLLQIIAHPDISGSSFTSQFAKAFVNGVKSKKDNWVIETVNCFNKLDLVDLKSKIKDANHLCFAFPLWWEMPPAALVDLLQLVFVQGFAFEKVNGETKQLLSVPVTCLISMGQDKQFNTSNLGDAMRYCGLHPKFVIFNKVSPNLSDRLIEEYLKMAYRHGQEI